MPTEFKINHTSTLKDVEFRLRKNPPKFKRFSVSKEFDEVISGIPYGLTIFYGEPGTGKSYMAQFIANNAVSRNLNVLYVYSESSMDIFNLDPKIYTANYTMFLPRWEKVLDQLYALLEYTKADLLILDSLTKLFSETNKAVEEAELRGALSELKQNINNAIPIIAISQVRGQGAFVYPAGGRAIDHESDLLIFFERLSYRPENQKIRKSVTNTIYTIMVEKDKQGMADQHSKYSVMYEFDHERKKEIIRFKKLED